MNALVAPSTTRVAARVASPASRARRNPRAAAVGRSATRRSSIATASASASSSPSSSGDRGRRAVLSDAALAAILANVSVGTRAARAGDDKMVGAYLPEDATVPGFYDFTPDAKRTPALRADALGIYHIALPPTWKEAPVSNARSGNYCQPRCDEATTEVQFVDPTAGSVQIIIIPTTKLLIAKNEPSIEDVGELNGLINAISPSITGSVAVEPEEIVSAEEVKHEGKTYYAYELLTPFAEFGLHNVAKVSTSKNYVVIAALAASEKQWGKSEADCKKILDSFRVNV